uniref:Major facilitator superfamily (MFS) profile domain-containing protein n=1 Tax=Spongospora subterranea TaxID=70186 RepID=A0A0H5QKJ6_9EUKA|eukprot:CRZ01821.1 hypothetical protein [Spongospora subterranea]
MWIVQGLVMLPLTLICVALPERFSQLENSAGYQSSFFGDVRTVMSSPIFRWTVLGYALQTFVVGGISSFGVSYLQEAIGLSPTMSTLIFGLEVVISGVAGTALGGYLLDRNNQTHIEVDHAGSVSSIDPEKLITPSVSDGEINSWVIAQGPVNDAARTVTAARILIYAALTALPVFALTFASLNVYMFCIGSMFTEICIFACLSPCNGVIMWSQTSPSLRPLAMALSTMLIHALGDAASPSVVGALVDYSGNWLVSFRLLGIWLVLSLGAWWRTANLAQLEFRKAALEIDQEY